VAAFRFSRRAEADLLSIGDYTLHTWGKAQAARYVGELEVCCQTLSDNPALGRKLKKMLVERGKGGLLFPTSSGKPKFDFLDMSKTVAVRAGIPEADAYLHKFRSTFATRALWSGVDLRTVQSWMGHTDLASTMRTSVRSATQQCGKRSKPSGRHRRASCLFVRSCRWDISIRSFHRLRSPPTPTS
jgi:plasmid stabilization system protein ParE